MTRKQADTLAVDFWGYQGTGETLTQQEVDWGQGTRRMGEVWISRDSTGRLKCWGRAWGKEKSDLGKGVSESWGQLLGEGGSSREG